MLHKVDHPRCFKSQWAGPIRANHKKHPKQTAKKPV
jgi:hypothetical protein